MVMNKILFLCTGNYYRSRFCEFFFNDLALKKELKWQATSRGLNVNPESGNVGAISVYVIEALESIGINLNTSFLREPMPVQQDDLEKADKIIAVDEVAHRPLIKNNFPHWTEKVEYWEVRDLNENPSQPPLLELEKKINVLLDELTINNSWAKYIFSNYKQFDLALDNLSLYS